MNVSLRAAASLCLALTLHSAQGQSVASNEKPFPMNLTPLLLQRVFLACDRAASRARLAMEDALQCSVVYEELKRRVFAGDDDRLLAWWRENRQGAEPRPAAGAAP